MNLFVGLMMILAGLVIWAAIIALILFVGCKVFAWLMDLFDL